MCSDHKRNQQNEQQHQQQPPKKNNIVMTNGFYVCCVSKPISFLPSNVPHQYKFTYAAHVQTYARHITYTNTRQRI